MTNTINPGRKGRLRALIARQNGALLVFIALWLAVMLFIPRFRTLNNQLTLLRQAAVPVIGSLGMMFVLISGGIDLSVGYTVGFVSALAGILMADERFMLPVWLAVILCLLTGMLLGFINGALVSILKIPAFITTVGMGYVIFGLINIITDGNTTNKLPQSFIAIGKTMILGQQSMVYISLAIILLSYFLLNRTTFGRHLTAVGFNPRACYITGVNVNRVTAAPYVLNGLMGAVCALLLTIRVNCGQPDMGGSTFNFEAITAAVIGGTSLFGGSGSVLGCVFGVLAVKLIEKSITMLGVTPHVYKAVLGLVILWAIIFDMSRKKNVR